jgi:hypothetical protein
VAIGYQKSTSSSRYLIPKGDSEIDVTKMAWTKSPLSSRANVPYMHLTEYQQNVGQLISSIIFYTKAVANVVNGNDGLIAGTKDDKSIYQFKYFAEPTGFSYKIPYFNQKKTSKTNQFGYEKSENPFSGLMGITNSFGASNVLANIAGIAGAGMAMANTLLPGKINLENPQSWTDSGEPEYSVTWDLNNTGTVDDISNNRNLAYILAYQNSPARRSAFIVDPPVIYSMYIPDVISMPACYVSNIEITNLGNTRTMFLSVDEVPRIIPEAYRFNLTFKSLLMDTRNIMNGLDSGNNLSAISDSRKLTAIYNKIAKLYKLEPGTPEANKIFGDVLQDAKAFDQQNGLSTGTTASTINPLIDNYGY